MRKIGFITTNKVFAQSLAAAIRNYPILEFEPFLLMNPDQVLLDAEILKIEAAVIDMAVEPLKGPMSIWPLCERLRQSVPKIKILLLVQQGDDVRKLAMDVVKKNVADDYVFGDTSLDYLLTKLLALSEIRL